MTRYVRFMRPDVMFLIRSVRFLTPGMMFLPHARFFYPRYDVFDLRHAVLQSSSRQTFSLLSFLPHGCCKVKKSVNSFYGTSHFLDNPAATIDVLTGSGSP